VYYHGTLVPQRLPLSLLAAVASLPETVRLRVAGYETIGHPNFSRRLVDEANRLGIQGRVEILPAAPRRELFRISADQDVGVALMPHDSNDINMRYMVGASNKATDYLAAGLALLVSDLPDWRSAYMEPGYGRDCDPRTPSSIAQALRWFLEHRDATRTMGERGRQRLLTEWNYDRAFEPVLAAMSGGTASNRKRSS
jgi:glycosyltransferase involved in cell wall biosynthesis